MYWVLILEKIIFWLLYVIPYLLHILLWLVLMKSPTTNYSSSLLNNLLSKVNSNIVQHSNIFSDSYDNIIAIFYGLGLFGIYTYLYNKKYFSKKIWIFIMVILLIDDIGKYLYAIEVLSNTRDYFLPWIFLIYMIPYYLRLYSLNKIKR